MITSPRWKRRIGIIDLGSNSARLMVAQYTPGDSYKVTYEYSRRVRLAEGMAEDERLRPEAMARAIETLRMFRSFCRANGVRRVIPVATAATRDAKNGARFVARVRARTGLRLRVLSGEEEALYGVVGAINRIGVRAGLVLDVGGGSAEISRVQDGRFARGLTLPLGAVRLTEEHLPGDRVRPADVKRLARHVRDLLGAVDWMTLGEDEHFVGLGGTIRSLARIDREERNHPLRLLGGYVLDAERLDRLVDRLRMVPASERAQRIAGLSNDRADVILAGAMVVAAALRRAGASSLVVSDEGLREGLLYREFLGRRPSPVIPHLRRFSVLNLGRVYGYQTAHADQVARLAVALLEQIGGRLRDDHDDGDLAAEREYLWAAAQLNDIGTAVNAQDHHKHSSYLIRNTGLSGYTQREMVLIASLCIYQRKGKADVKSYKDLLEKGDSQRLKQLGAILRIAEALDSSRTQGVASVRAQVRRNVVRVRVRAKPKHDVRWEVGEAQRNAALFEDAFGCRLDVESS